METTWCEAVLPAGQTCFVPSPREMSLTGFILAEQGDWFEDELAFVRRLVEPGWTCVDVGAAVGVYALGMAQSAGPAGQVIAIEPHPRLAAALHRTVSARPAGAPIEIVTSAIAAGKGSGRLSDPKDPELAELKEDGVFEVETVSLDDLLAGRPVPDLIKIDVEGGGAAALAGAARILDSGRTIVQFVLRQGSRHQTEACAHLVERGYQIHRLLPGLNLLVPLLPGEAVDPFLINAIAVPKEGRITSLRQRGLAVTALGEASPLPEGVKVQGIIEDIAQQGWIARFKPAWQPNAIMPGWESQRRAVAMQALAEDQRLSPATRAGCLVQAQVAVRKALAASVNGSRLATAARICAAAGNRTEAARAVEALLPSIEKNASELPATFTEPFLLPMRMHEGLPYGSFPELLNGALLEAAAFLPVYSAYFQGPNRLPTYERLAKLPVRSLRVDTVVDMLRQLNRRQAPKLLRL